MIQWTPIKKSVPPFGVRVLLYSRDNHIVTGFHYANGDYHTSDGGVPLADVTHWAPLPKPPKPERIECWAMPWVGEPTPGEGLEIKSTLAFTKPADAQAIHLRQVIPGDPDPDTIRRVAERLRDHASGYNDRDELDSLAHLLEGKR